jgi:glycerol-3-phosphate acyltransferase PlsX
LKPVALDAMGGDEAPDTTVAGAVQAARESGLGVVLVGDQAAIEAELARHGPTPAGLEIAHAAATIEMDESPGAALLRKRDSSIMVAMNLVKEGAACGVVSAGNSGAVTGAAVLRLGMLPQVERPAIATVFPSRRSGVVVLDVGATVDCRPEHLVDFAHLGATYAKSLLAVENPRVGLLSIGEEPSKGNTLVKKAHALLKQSSLHFIGNIEGKELARGDVDVVVCDGFAGNILLKSVEGFAELFLSMLRERMGSGLRSSLGGWLLRPALKRMVGQLDYATYGGALLAGVNGIVVIGHGRSTAAAVANAIRVASDLARHRVVEELTTCFSQLDTAAMSAAAATDVSTC